MRGRGFGPVIFVFHSLVQPLVFFMPLRHSWLYSLLFIAHADFDAGWTNVLHTEGVAFEALPRQWYCSGFVTWLGGAL